MSAPQSHQALRELLEAAKAYRMTPAEREAQRISFVYGNLHIENPNITREMVERAARR